MNKISFQYLICIGLVLFFSNYYSTVNSMPVTSPPNNRSDFIGGDVNSDSLVNIFDITFLLTYLFDNGPSPAQMETADTNDDAIVNIYDVFYLISYLYERSSIVIYGDTRTNHFMHQQIVDSIRTVRPHTVFHTGDLVNNGYSQGDWDMFNLITEQMISEVEFYPALGNHENQSPLFFELFDLPNNEQWYSIDLQGIHFVILNSCVAIDSTSEQYQWLVNDFNSLDESNKYIVVIFHHPPYSTGPHTEDEKGLREKIVPLFGQYGVDIVFNGHDHDYERSHCGGIYYIVAGGGGAPLRNQARSHPCSQLFEKKYHFCIISRICSKLILKVYDKNMALIDILELTH